jgi:DNA-directed RNA polymerase sigma subunit (sigma70/sigma32)
VTRVLDATTPLLSLDAPAFGTDDSHGDTMGSFVADDAPSVADLAERTTFRAVLERMLAVLDEREQLLVRMRFGLGGGEPATNREIASALHLSTERVRQIEARAMSKLRHPSVEPGARRFSRAEADPGATVAV